MARARTGKDDLRVFGMAVDEVVPVGCVGVETDRRVDEGAVGVGHELTEACAHRLVVGLRHRAVYRIGMIDESTFLVDAGFYAPAQVWKAVEEQLGAIFPDVNRAA